MITTILLLIFCVGFCISLYRKLRIFQTTKDLTGVCERLQKEELMFRWIHHHQGLDDSPKDIAKGGKEEVVQQVWFCVFADTLLTPFWLFPWLLYLVLRRFCKNIFDSTLSLFEYKKPEEKTETIDELLEQIKELKSQIRNNDE